MVFKDDCWSSRRAPLAQMIDGLSFKSFSCLSLRGAKFRTRKGAIKLHTVLTGLLPQCVLITDGKTHERWAVQDLQPEDLLIFDRAYLDYACLYQLHQGGVWFVTRLKTNSCYEGTRAGCLPARSWPTRLSG